jgi:hypothetical protein
MSIDPSAARAEPWYSDRRGARFAPLTGVVAVILWVIGIAIAEGGAETPDEDAGVQEFARYFNDDSGPILAGAFIFMIGSAVLLWFLGSLRARIAGLEGGVGRVASIVFAAGVVTVAMSLGFNAPEAAAAFAAEQIEGGIDPSAAQALWILGDGFFIAAEVAVAIFFLAAWIAGLRTRAVPVWLAWASLVLGVAAFFPWVGWAVLIWGFPLWVLVASVWMFVRPLQPVTVTAAA